jgi:hypothetical protein
MDSNKLQVLRDIDYTINKCCGNCQHSSFKGGSLFGLCLVKENEYVHLKHTGEKRKLSINYFGECDKHNFQKRFEDSLEGFKEFVRE